MSDMKENLYPMALNPKTAQHVFLMLAGTFCLIVVGVVGCLIAAIFVFGDGEAQKIISDMTPVALGSIGALALVFTGHTISGIAGMQLFASSISPASAAQGAASSPESAQTVQSTPAPASAFVAPQTTQTPPQAGA